MDHPYPWLRYLDADDLDDAGVDFDDMKVESASGEHLGEVDGFIVDSESGRPYYVVVESGGWFKSKHFLLPVGHAHYQADRHVLAADLTRDRVERFPGFHRTEFDKLTVDDLTRLNQETLRAVGTTYTYLDSEPYSAVWDRPAFKYPEWWRRETRASRPDTTPAAGVAGTPSATTEPIERPVRDRDTVVAHRDTSPHFDGRAQPGDVIGVETGGERTHVGETAEDENTRREDAEKAVTRRRE